MLLRAEVRKHSWNEWYWAAMHPAAVTGGMWQAHHVPGSSYVGVDSPEVWQALPDCLDDV